MMKFFIRGWTGESNGGIFSSKESCQTYPKSQVIAQFILILAENLRCDVIELLVVKDMATKRA